MRNRIRNARPLGFVIPEPAHSSTRPARPPRTIQHITLQTGHVCTSPRHEVDDRVLRLLIPPIRSAFRNDAPRRTKLTFIPGFSVSATRQGQSALVTLWAGVGGLEDGGVALQEGGPCAPIITTGVAADARAGRELWEILHRDDDSSYHLVTDMANQPSAPWCADRMEPGIMLFPKLTAWTGDYSRCVAWAVLDILRGP